MEKTRDIGELRVDRNKKATSLPLWLEVGTLAHTWLPANFKAGMQKLSFHRFNACIAAPLRIATDSADSTQQDFTLGTFPVKPGEHSDGDAAGSSLQCPTTTSNARYRTA